MYGRPLLFENQYGVLTETHNYYAILALGPLTKLFGAYGLFAGFLLLLFLAARSSLLFLDRGSSGWTQTRIVFGSLLLGPVGFWFWDHPIYGFHLELLLLPLGILYALSLIDGSRRRWLWLAPICLTHEQGPLFACLGVLPQYLFDPPVVVCGPRDASGYCCALPRVARAR